MNQEMPSRGRSAKGYDRLSGFYRWIEWIGMGSDLMHARTALLPELHAAKRILVLGDGDGRLLAALATSQPDAHITSVDHSPKMLDLQRTRVQGVGAEERVEFVCADATAIIFEGGKTAVSKPTGLSSSLDSRFSEDSQTFALGSYDLLVTAFFLDCFSQKQIDVLLPGLLGAVRPGGQFYFVDFIEPTKGYRRVRAQILLAIMHLFFRWQTGLRNTRLVDVPSQIDQLGWQFSKHQSHSKQLITARIYEQIS